ncbi:MAG: hypothetical protein NT042_08430 [Sulfuritalea sp.]|nr:hypothetical protein [Sulfuritalea sp.]
MSILDRITGNNKPNALEQLFEQRAAAIATVQTDADKLCSSLDAVVLLTNQIWRALPERPLSTPPTFSKRLFGRLTHYLWGRSDGRLGNAHESPYVASQRPSLVEAAEADHTLLRSLIAKTSAMVP